MTIVEIRLVYVNIMLQLNYTACEFKCVIRVT